MYVKPGPCGRSCSATFLATSNALGPNAAMPEPPKASMMTSTLRDEMVLGSQDSTSAGSPTTGVTTNQGVSWGVMARRKGQGLTFVGLEGLGRRRRAGLAVDLVSGGDKGFGGRVADEPGGSVNARDVLSARRTCSAIRGGHRPEDEDLHVGFRGRMVR